MKQGIISKVSPIANNSKGETINVVVIRLTNGTTIVRQLKPFVIDLQNSGRMLGINPDTITSVTHPMIGAECAKLKGGKVEGDYKMVHEGEEYEDTNPASPEFGKMKKYKTDFIRVEGFLDVTPSEDVLQREENAVATANLSAQLKGLFNSTAVSTGSNSTDGADDEIPAELLDELATEETDE